MRILSFDNTIETEQFINHRLSATVCYSFGARSISKPIVCLEDLALENPLKVHKNNL